MNEAMIEAMAAGKAPDVGQIPYLGENEFWVWTEDDWENGSHMCGWANREEMVKRYCDDACLQPEKRYTIRAIDSGGNLLETVVYGEVATFFSMLKAFA